MSPTDMLAARNMIDQIWYAYDEDKSGALDKAETKVFVEDILKTVGKAQFTEEQYDEIFSGFDEDGSGCVEKGEMLDFILMILGNS